MGRTARIREMLAFVALCPLAWLFPAPAADAHTVYAADVFGWRVVPITGEVEAQTPIDVDYPPQAIAITPDGTQAWVVIGASRVAVIDTETNSVVDTFIVDEVLADDHLGIAISPDGARAYVVGPFYGFFYAIDTETHSVVDATYVCFSASAIAIAPDGARAYVTCSGDDTVKVIDTEELGVVDTIPVGDNPRGVAITPDGARAYVTAHSGGKVSVIETATNTVIATISVSGSPMGITITPDGGTAYVASWGTNSVVPLDTRTNVPGTPIPVGDSPTAIAITPDGRTGYVNNSAYVDTSGGATVSLLDLKEGTVRAEIPIGPGNTGWGIPISAGVVVVPNQTPTADLEVDPPTVYVGEPVTFDASGSSDDMGVEGYLFDFGDGWLFRSGQPVRQHTYTEPGTYEATVTVDDGEGCPRRDRLSPGLALPYTGQSPYCGGPSEATSDVVEVNVQELPKLGVWISHKLKQPLRRSVRVTAICTSLDCEASAGGTIEVRRRGSKPKRFKLKPASRALSADVQATLTPKIPAKARRAARKALKAGGKVRARVRVVAKGAGDQRRVKNGRVRIVR